MKTLTLPCFFCLSLLVSLNASAEGDPQPTYRDVATHEQLATRLSKMEKIDPMKKLQESTGVDPAKLNQPANLLEQSDILSFNGLTTLVPKRAIICSPSTLKDRLKHQTPSRFVPWNEFLSANQGWITTIEVSREQAEGNKPFSEETQLRISKSKNLIVATYLGGPISVLPIKETKTVAEPTQNPKP